MITAALLYLTAPTATYTRYRDRDTGFIFAMPAAPQVRSKLTHGVTMHSYQCFANNRFYFVTCGRIPEKDRIAISACMKKDRSNSKVRGPLDAMVSDFNKPGSSFLKTDKADFQGWPSRADLATSGRGVNFAFRSVLTDQGLFVASVSAHNELPNSDPFFGFLEVPPAR